MFEAREAAWKEQNEWDWPPYYAFRAGFDAGVAWARENQEPCPECEERERERWEADEGMRNAFEMNGGKW